MEGLCSQLHPEHLAVAAVSHNGHKVDVFQQAEQCSEVMVRFGTHSVVVDREDLMSNHVTAAD
jgi:hypothetical protein